MIIFFHVEALPLYDASGGDVWINFLFCKCSSHDKELHYNSLRMMNRIEFSFVIISIEPEKFEILDTKGLIVIS